MELETHWEKVFAAMIIKTNNSIPYMYITILIFVDNKLYMLYTKHINLITSFELLNSMKNLFTLKSSF